MKKIVIAVMAIGALTFSSCNNSTKKSDSNIDTTQVVGSATNSADDLLSQLQAQLNSKDANAIQTTLGMIQAKYAELLQSGKLEEAKAYLTTVQSFIKEHADQISSAAGGNTVVTSLVDKISNIPSSTEEAVKSAKDNLKESASKASENAKESVEEKVEETKNAAKEKINNAADKVSKKTNEAASKAVKDLGL